MLMLRSLVIKTRWVSTLCEHTLQDSIIYSWVRPSVVLGEEDPSTRHERQHHKDELRRRKQNFCLISSIRLSTLSQRWYLRLEFIEQMQTVEHFCGYSLCASLSCALS